MDDSSWKLAVTRRNKGRERGWHHIQRSRRGFHMQELQQSAILRFGPAATTADATQPQTD